MVRSFGRACGNRAVQRLAFRRPFARNSSRPEQIRRTELRLRQEHEFALCSLALPEIERRSPLPQAERASDPHCEFPVHCKLCELAQDVVAHAHGRFFDVGADAQFLCRGEIGDGDRALGVCGTETFRAGRT